MTEIWQIAFTRHISYKLSVNVNVSKMAFTQKKQVRLNREGGSPSTLLVVSKKNFVIYCFQLASRLVSFLPTGPVGVAAL